LVDAIEALEDARLLVERNSRTGVVDLAPRQRAIAAEEDPDLATLGVLDRVVQQIGDDLLDLSAIGLDRLGLSGIAAQLEPHTARPLAERGDLGLGDRAQIQRLGPHLS